jgi:hypothetical protein
MSKLVVIGLILFLLLGTLPTWSYSKSWEYYPSSFIGVILVIFLILMLLERI